MTVHPAFHFEIAFWFIFFFGYAEIHYRFRLIPSRYYSKLPEIIADIPARLEPGQDLPLLLLIKDAHLFPIQCQKIEVHISEGRGPNRCQTFQIKEKINSLWWYRLFWIRRHLEDGGLRKIVVIISIQSNGKLRRFKSDNYKTLNHRPFHTFFAREPLPQFHNFYSGDLHTHSWYTSDQVEFGAPPEALVAMARAQGHHFLAITDHSYDLDDEPENFLRNDRLLRKWHALQKEIQSINAREKEFIALPGEEVSCGNAKGKNVHFLILNHSDYIPGAGDSGEKWFQTRPELSIGEILARLRDRALSFAAHPAAPVPILERILLRRGYWQQDDFSSPKLTGLQIWNGKSVGTEKAEAAWVQLLLKGKRIFIIAGSDAHGNFNRFRQVGMPHLYLHEKENFHIYGLHRTAAFIPGEFNLNSLLRSLQKGAISISSGPFLAIVGHQPIRPAIPMGSNLQGYPAYLELIAISSPEFGPIQSLQLYVGDLANQNEVLFLHQKFTHQTYLYRTVLELPEALTKKYYRAELSCENQPGLLRRALTNPIWHNPDESL